MAVTLRKERQGRSPLRTNSDTVLVVDDEEAVRATIAELFGLLGYAVKEAGDGLEALEIFGRAQGNFRLVATDFDMPRMDGVRLTQCLKAADPDVKVIVLTGDPDLVRKSAIAAGATAVSEKALTLEELVVLVQSASG